MRSKNQSKFIGKNLVHAIKFFKFVMGGNIELEETLGPMLQGRVMRILATREPTQQARALTVQEVLQLEAMVHTSRCLLDKYFAGCLLFALFSRARWSSDLSSMQSFGFDVMETDSGPFGFVEDRTDLEYGREEGAVSPFCRVWAKNRGHRHGDQSWRN